MLEPARMGAWFSGSISLLALLIAATGIYGMLSYVVTERTSEIGIRMALGAQRRNVTLLIVGDGMKLAGIGTGIGVAGAFVLTKLMSSMLFGIAGTDALDICSGVNRLTRCRITRVLHPRPARNEGRSAGCVTKRMTANSTNSETGTKLDPNQVKGRERWLPYLFLRRKLLDDIKIDPLRSHILFLFSE
jgi:ABC-type antimicrobial peptide transport system permease subunit